MLRTPVAAAAPPTSVMNSRRLMSFVLQVEDHTLAHRWAREVLCITAKWAADCLLWVIFDRVGLD
jgi:hypothetical protein